jgi:monoamine oxidase
VASGFATGDFADAVSRLSHAEAAHALMAQLARLLPRLFDRMLAEADGHTNANGHTNGNGHTNAAAENDADAAGAALAEAALAEAVLLERLRGSMVSAHVVDWAAEEWVGGGYSTLSVGEEPHARAAYRAPAHGGLVCFCGEATEDAMMTMSAAIESGRRAAAEVLEAVAGPRAERSRL